jgi:hypothetical protein
MSIVWDIEERCKDGRLFRLGPRMGTPSRQLVVSRSIQALLDGPWDNDAEEIRYGALYADLESYVVGGRLTFSDRPRDNRNAYLAALDPLKDGIWEIRSPNPRPGLRLLGYFVKVDYFVALWAGERKGLKQYGSREWAKATKNCRGEWNRLFPADPPPLTGSRNLHDYISQGAVLV